MVTVRDDGGGIDTAKLRKLVGSRPGQDGVVTDLTEEAAMALVFATGVSTADVVSDISGRGVGMDAARAAVEALGGSIEVKSSTAAGTVVCLRFPLVAIITTVVVVKAGRDQFGIPIDNLKETGRIPHSSVHSIKSGFAFVLRDRTMPLLNLSQLLGNAAAAQREGDVKVVIAKSGSQSVGIEVDGFGESIDVMLRPPRGVLAGVRGVSGTALLGDGSVLLILNLMDLIE